MTTRLEAIQRAAAAYALTPAAGVQRIGWRDIHADLFSIDGAIGIFVKGTDPQNFENLARDADVADETSTAHPRLGPLFAGAYDAALGLLPQILQITGDRRLIPGGHSLGGQIATDITGLVNDEQPGRVPEMWGFDPPKAGWQELETALVPVRCNIFRFAGSIVSRWPFERGVHVRAPVVIGDWTLNLLQAHSIARAAAWVMTQTAA